MGNGREGKRKGKGKKGKKEEGGGGREGKVAS